MRNMEWLRAALLYFNSGDGAGISCSDPQGLNGGSRGNGVAGWGCDEKLEVTTGKKAHISFLQNV